MYQLFYAPGSASMGVRALLEEIGAPYELLETSIARGAARPPEQLAINPNGWVPVLTWDGGAMYEGAAITVFLCDRHPDAQLAPAWDHPTRALYLQTLSYFSSSVQTAFQLSYYPDRFVAGPTDHPSAQARGNLRLNEVWSIVDQQIGGNDWVLGTQFSAVDLYLFMLTTWLDPSRGHPTVDAFPNVKRIAERVAQRPCVRRVYGT